MIYYILNNWHSDAHNHNVCKLFNKFLCKCICCVFFHWIYYVLWKKENQPLLMDTINNRDIFISVHALFACFDASSNNVAECLRKRILNCEYIRELQTADTDAFITNRLSAIINVVDDEFSKFIAIQCANHALKFIRYVNEYIWIRSVWQYYFNVLLSVWAKCSVHISNSNWKIGSDFKCYIHIKLRNCWEMPMVSTVCSI